MTRDTSGRGLLRLFSVALCAACAAPFAMAQPAGPMPGMGGAAEVGIITLSETEVPFSVTVPGRAVAFEEVDIRPRVAGAIAEIAYRPGLPVAAGDVLFVIEADTYAAEVASAEASVARAEAAFRTAEATLRRYETLAGTGVSAQDLESAQVSLLQAEADLRAAQASLQTQQLYLDRTAIRSPIDGFADIPTVSVGALVTENQADALTTITRIDPIFVDVEESSRRIADIRTRVEQGQLQTGENLGIRLRLETGETYELDGQMVSPGTRVSQTTGTLALRLQFPNPERRVLPGQFLRVDIELGTIRAILVPQGATARSAIGALTAFVVEDGVARQRVLAEQGSHSNAWVITSGLADGEQLIVDGLNMLRDGAEVRPVPVEITAEGVTRRVDGQSDDFQPPAAMPAGGMPGGMPPGGAPAGGN
ncbi:MAG: efflux RND transporter periplasmic adaptor subunit [Pararhodobacter sp.]